jgi:uncharacterized damage-inducible protein DinB
MQRNITLSQRLREVFLDGKWIANTNYQEQIFDLPWYQANYKIHDLNSVALLTFHINYYLKGLLHLFDGGKLEIRDQYSFDMQNITNEKEWNELKLKFLTNAEAFCNKVEELDEAILNEAFVDEKYGTYLRNIEAVIEHSYYHLGQIILIKKMIMHKSN